MFKPKFQQAAERKNHLEDEESEVTDLRRTVQRLDKLTQELTEKNNQQDQMISSLTQTINVMNERTKSQGCIKQTD